jgi:DNA-directed RNA polymerase subunit N (RpoN/RPB10)
VNFRFVDLGGIDSHCCLEVIVHSVDLGGIDDHCCLEVIVRFVDLGGLMTIAV